MPEVVESAQSELPLVAPTRFELPPDQPEESKASEAPAAAPTGENTGEQATPAKPEGEKPDTEKDDPEKRGTRRFERRIQKAYQKMAEEKARADFLQRQLEETKSKAAVVPIDNAAPTLEQHGYDPEKYAEARVNYEKDKAIKEYQWRQREESQKQSIERVSTDWELKTTKAEDKYEDFEEKVGKLDPRNPVVLAIMESDIGTDIAYHLGSNPEDAKKIFSLSPASAIREIGKLEARLSTPAEKPKATSKAPAPITPLTGTAPISSSEPSEADDMASWIRKRNKQVHGRR